MLISIGFTKEYKTRISSWLAISNTLVFASANNELAYTNSSIFVAGRARIA